VTVNRPVEFGGLCRVLRARLAQLDAALSIWTTRAARPQSEVTQADQDVRAAIDSLLHALHQLRPHLDDQTPDPTQAQAAIQAATARTKPLAHSLRTDHDVRRWRDTGSGPGWTPNGSTNHIVLDDAGGE
jgi:hypothetical protein